MNILSAITPVDIVLFILVGLVSIVVPATVVFLVNRILNKFSTKRDKELNDLDELRERRNKDERESLKQNIVQVLEDAVSPIARDLEVIKRGTQAVLRHDLSQMADEWLEKGFCPRNVKEDFENIYNQYHNLGENGVMDSTYQAILALPEKEPKQRAPRTSKASLAVAHANQKSKVKSTKTIING